MEEIIQQLLSRLELNPNTPIEDIINNISDEMCLNPKDLTELNSIFNMLDSIRENATDLAQKKVSGMTRAGWIEERLSIISESSDENPEKLISQIVEGVQSGVDDTLSQEV